MKTRMIDKFERSHHGIHWFEKNFNFLAYFQGCASTTQFSVGIGVVVVVVVFGGVVAGVIVVVIVAVVVVVVIVDAVVVAVAVITVALIVLDLDNIHGIVIFIHQRL
eukprot:c27732_g1_i1.p1 GENE.c27732_g1_i1~~c27732_g1_i1.p1  ORF type:complete len:107 (-),score=32.00 c27732_g1_i1:171-491(-)